MPERQLDFQYVAIFLKNVGVRITSEPGEYIVIRRGGMEFGPWEERRSFDNLPEAFRYGLQLSLLPPFYRARPKRKPRDPNATGHNARAYEIRRQQAEARRDEIEAERAAVAARREAMIRAELAKLDTSS